MNVIQLDPRAIAYVQRMSRKYNQSESEIINEAIEMYASCCEFAGYSSDTNVWDALEQYGYKEDRPELRAGGDR